jgi:methylated-DNA-protein-cysteine methyltransferase related protein
VAKSRAPDQPVDSLYARIYATVRRIPRGRVSTYGRIASLVAGCSARQVGYAMAALPEGSRVPWQRVINHKGEVSARKHGSGAGAQRLQLVAEGVHFDLRGRIDLRRYVWPDP